MASWERGAGFRITGAVVRKYVPPSGKCAFLTLGTPGNRGEQKTDCKTFDLLVVEEIAALGVGQTVQVTGSVESEKVKDKKGNEILVDGYAKWVPSLVVKTVAVEGASVAPSSGAAAPQAKEDKGW